MVPPSARNPLDSVTAALGGRRVYLSLWMLWLFAAAVGHYLQDFKTVESIGARTRVAFAVCIAGLALSSALLVYNLSSKEKRFELCRLDTELPKVSDSFRALVWIVPIVALGALISPALPW